MHKADVEPKHEDNVLQDKQKYVDPPQEAEEEACMTLTQWEP